jgi:hypothetical protein
LFQISVEAGLSAIERNAVMLCRQELNFQGQSYSRSELRRGGSCISSRRA